MDSQNLFKISFGNKTDVGKVRERNEDYMESFECKFGNVFVVCDGMGGHIGGEIASRIAAATIKNIFITNPKRLISTYELIEDGFYEANRAILAKSQEDTSLKGMGTTCVILVLKNNMAYYGHIGDSRLYLVRSKKIYQLTKDHSTVQDLVDGNFISDEEAEFHPRRNEITRALGVTKIINPEIKRKGFLVYKDDIFIICSDGLSNLISEREMMEIVLYNTPINACKLLVDMANTAGGSDNITVQIVKVIEGNPFPEEFKNVIPDGAIIKSDLRQASDILVKNGSDSKSKKSHRKLFYILIPILIIVISLLFIVLSTREDKVGGNEQDSTTSEVKNIKEFNSRLKEDLKSILEYIYLSKEYPTNIKFERNKELELIEKNGNTTKIKIDSLRAKYISKPFNKVKIEESRLEENRCIFILENEKMLEYELEFRLEENKIIFEKIRFNKYITPPHIQEERDGGTKSSGKQPNGKNQNNEKENKQPDNEKENKQPDNKKEKRELPPKEEDSKQPDNKKEKRELPPK